MTEKNPIEMLVDKISDILQVFEENREKPLRGEPTNADLAVMGSLVLQVEAMQEAYQVALKSEGMTDEEVLKVLQGNRVNLSEKNRQLLDKIERMKKEIQFDHDVINRSIEERRRKKGKTGVSFKGEGKKRRKADVAIGFRKQWKKM